MPDYIVRVHRYNQDSGRMEGVKAVNTAVAIGISIAVGLFVIVTFGGTFTTGTAASNAINSIVNALGSAVTNVVVPLVSLLFVLVLYNYVQKSGLLGSSGKKG